MFCCDVNIRCYTPTKLVQTQITGSIWIVQCHGVITDVYYFLIMCLYYMYNSTIPLNSAGFFRNCAWISIKQEKKLIFFSFCYNVRHFSQERDWYTYMYIISRNLYGSYIMYKLYCTFPDILSVHVILESVLYMYSNIWVTLVQLLNSPPKFC